MKCLSNKQQEEREALVQDLQVHAAEINSVMVEINRLVSERLNVAITNYNQGLAQARSFRDDVANSISQTDTSDMTEGEKAAMSDWLSEWEEANLEDADVVLGFEGPDVDHGEELLSLAYEPAMP